MSCDNEPDDGCETSIRTLSDCGSCQAACVQPHAVTTCATGRCEVTACDGGWADCSDAAGCERQLDTCIGECCSVVEEDSYPADGAGCTRPRTITGSAEGCFGFRLVEQIVAGCAPTQARIDLEVPDGIDLELRVTVLSGSAEVLCTHLLSSNGSTEPGCVGTNPVGDDERVYVSRPETCFSAAGDLDSETFSIQVEVNWISGRSCEMWTLHINTGKDC
jgi:hypothetical protein